MSEDPWAELALKYLDRLEKFWLTNPEVPEHLRPALHRDIEFLCRIIRERTVIEGRA